MNEQHNLYYRMPGYCSYSHRVMFVLRGELVEVQPYRWDDGAGWIACNWSETPSGSRVLYQTAFHTRITLNIFDAREVWNQIRKDGWETRI